MLRKNLPTIFIFILLNLQFAFADEIKIKVHSSSGSTIAHVPTGNSENLEDPILVSDKFIEKSRIFVSSVTSELRPLGVFTDSYGMKHVRYQQIYQGVPVIGAEVIAHIDIKGTIKSVTGRTIKQINLSVIPSISSAKALSLTKESYRSAHPWDYVKKYARSVIKNRCRAKASKQQKRLRRSRCFRKRFRLTRKAIRPKILNEPSLVILNEKFKYGQQAGKSVLTYHVKITNRTDITTESFYIDAISGKLIKRLDGLHSATNRKIFDCSRPNTELCYLDSASAVHNYTFGRSEGYPIVGSNPISGYFFGSTDVDDMYDHIQVMDGFLSSKFERDGANNRGGTGNGTSVAYSDTRVFANVDGSALGADRCFNEIPAWAGSTSLSVCKGKVFQHDLMGHEYAHIVARYMSFAGSTPISLLYEGESGALNEAHSDFMGEAFEKYMTGSYDWIFVTGGDYSWFRDMSDPTSSTPRDGDIYVYPDDYTHENFNCNAEEDNGGVHQNSGVMNKASYLMTDGGSFNDCTISGIGFDKVEQIWHRALTTYFTSSETFNMAYNSFQFACADFAANGTHGITLADCAEVTKALQAVKMDQDGGCSGTADPLAPATCAIPIEPDPIVGDFDTDTDVDASDYMVWYDSIDEVGEDLPADADNNLIVDSADCQIWKANYGTGDCTLNPEDTCSEDFEYFVGDFDRDGDVDTDDQIIWNQSYGSVVAPGSGADGNGDGKIDAADYTLWRDNLGDGTCSP